LSLTRDEIRQLSIDTSMVVLQNVSFTGHSGLVTLKLERGVVRRVWVGTPAGLLLWDAGRTIAFIVKNVGDHEEMVSDVA